MRAIMSVILMLVLTVASATAGIRHYCDTTPAISGLTIQGAPDYSTSYGYDLNGNPTQIYRKGISHKYASGSNRQWQYDEIDNLYIEYQGNQVNFTDDSCPWGYYEDAPGYIEESYDDNEYAWDANGNMTKDLNRGISSIQYNLQNQPTRIAYNDRHYENRLYNSLGEKLRTIHTVLVTSATSSSTSTTTLVTENKRDYYGEDLVYRNDTLEMVLTDNGYVDAQGCYYYYVRDYQGNIRQVVDAQGNVIEQNDYYPYGGLFGESASLHSYKYSGKELEMMNGLNTYDFHARPYYYPTLQFHSPDILSEKTPWNSPYLYCSGNPINRIDPTGMADIYAIKKGEAVLIGYNGVDDNNVYVVTGDVKKEVEKATKNENAYTGELSEGDNVVKIPTGNLMSGVVESVNQSEESQKENGGHAMKGSDIVVRWDEGGEPITDDKEISISIRPFKIGGKSKIPNNVNDVEFYWHTHPNRKINKNSSFGSSKPSPKDKTFQKEMHQSGYKGNAFIIGLRENKVTFYNKDKNIITMPYHVFVRLGNR